MAEDANVRERLEEVIAQTGERAITYWQPDKTKVVVRWSKWGTCPTVEVRKKNGATGTAYPSFNRLDTIEQAVGKAKREALTEKQRALQEQRRKEKYARQEEKRQAKIAAAAYLLVHCSYSVADEFTVHGWQLMTQEEWRETVEYYGSRTSATSVSYGNLFQDFDNGQDFLGTLGPKPISKLQYEVLRKTIGTSWGTARWPEDWANDDELEEAA